MAFQNLNKEDLLEVAEFFAVDVEAADSKNGPTKKEIVAALNEGDDPVTWEQYNEIFLKAKESGQDKAQEVKDAEALAEEEAKAADLAKASEEEPEEDNSPRMLVKMVRKNPRYDIRGYTFTQDHPFQSVKESDGDYIVRNIEGFVVALPSEVADYYN